MGGKSSLNKGKSGEREIVKLIQPIVDTCYLPYAEILGDAPIMQRNTLQSHLGGFDIVGLEWFAIEVKRCETLNLNAWWKQTLSQAYKDQTPILFYRQSRKAWRVRMTMRESTGLRTFTCVADISIDDFLTYLTARLEDELVKKVKILDVTNKLDLE